MAKKKYINLPKGYISYSQIAMWKSSPERYKQVYFNERPEYSIHNDAMNFGSKFATALEFNEETGNDLLDAAAALITKYDVRDQEIIAELKTKNGWVKLLGKPDTYDPATGIFREYKTGKTKWTQHKAENHLQIKLYAVIIYLAHGKVAKEAYLDWVETHDTQDGIQPTGRIETFKVKLGIGEIIKTMAEVKKIAEEIEIAWAIHEKRPKKPF